MNEVAEVGSVSQGSPVKIKKRLVRRLEADHSQWLRGVLQGLFFLLNLWIGWQFFRFVRFCESGGATTFVPRPAGVEGWLPIASMMNWKVLLFTGHVPAIHPAGLFLLSAFAGISWLFRKSFCSWFCPIGTFSEWLWKFGRRIFRRNLTLPRWFDVPLRSLKYVLLGLFGYAVASMSPSAILAFMEGPYGLIADVKMLNFFRYLSVTSAVVLGILVVLSIVVKNFWCRYLCPYGALLGLAALASPSRIRRESSLCIDCAKCARACPSLLPVDKLLSVRSAECTGCLECVASCPAQGALQMTIGKQHRLPTWGLAAGVVVIFLGVVGYAKWAGLWESPIPQQVYFQLAPRAQELSHP